MPRLSGKALAAYSKIHHIAHSPTIQDTFAACEAANIPVDLVNVRTAAVISSTTCTHIRKRIRRGEITAYRVGSRLVVSLSQVIRPKPAKTP